MTFLNNLFSSTESLALRLQSHEKAFEKIWNDYKGTIDDKAKILGQLPSSFGQRKVILERLRPLLDLELVDTRSEDEEEKDMIKDLEYLEHSKKIRRVHRLEDTLRYMETRHEYVHGLLHRLYIALRLEARFVDKMLRCMDLKKYRALIGQFKSEFEIERELLNKIGQIDSFHKILSSLAKGEHLIHKLDADEKELLKKMKRDMAKIFSKKTNKGTLYIWARTVFDMMDDRIREHIADGSLDPHDFVDFEYVNSQRFVELSREIISQLNKDMASDQIVNVFVHLFREWFNHEVN